MADALTFLKWAGNKAPLADTIASHLLPEGPVDCDYYEPFLGAGGVALHLLDKGLVNPKRVLLSDVNPRLVSLWSAVREYPTHLLAVLAALPTEGGAWQAVYHQNRDRFNDPGTPPDERAALFLWLNRACFNGLYRENRKGEFNVPVGRTTKGDGSLTMPSEAQIMRAHRLLVGVTIRCHPFEAAPRRHRIYADPPYVPLSATSSFTSYSGEFDMADQRRLAAWLSDHANACRVVASNSSAPAVAELYPPPWERHEVFVHRSVSRAAETRGKVAEVLLVRGEVSDG